MNSIGRRIMRCDECGAVFAPWEEVYSWHDGNKSEYVCCDCFDTLFDELSRFERAILIGSEVIIPDYLPPS